MDDAKPVPELAISRLARDVARNLVPLNEILQNSQISPDQYEAMVSHPFFQSRLQEELNSWNGDVRTRVAAKAATLIEDSLIEVYELIHDRSQPMPAKIEALKFAARLAAMDEGAVRTSTEDNRVTINISIGDKTLSFDKVRDNSKIVDAEVTDVVTT